jgi:hypothetical protein
MQKSDMIGGMPVTGKVLLISVLLHMVWDNSNGLLTWWAFVTWCVWKHFLSDVMSLFWQRTFVLFLHFRVYIFIDCFTCMYSYGPRNKITFIWKWIVQSWTDLKFDFHNVFTVFWCKETISKGTYYVTVLSMTVPLMQFVFIFQLTRYGR